MPPELFERPGFSLKPEPGRSGPKLWVRRLVIWQEPKIVIRDVSLRPGLNIIWSPDSQGPDSPVGHGGGKTTFCRLLRYCLGEETSAPQALRQRIGEIFPKGHVGAEVMLDGQLWIVVRALGHRRRDFIQRGGQLEDAFADGSKSTGMDQLIDAFTESVMGASASFDGKPPTPPFNPLSEAERLADRTTHSYLEITKKGTFMKLHRNQVCPIHHSRICCGREEASKARRLTNAIERIDDPNHPRGYRELRSPAELRKVLTQKISAQQGNCGICHLPFTDCNDVVPDHIEPKGMGAARRDDHPDNIQAAHRLCNLLKGSRRLSHHQHSE